jgi:hypothetical protein
MHLTRCGTVSGMSVGGGRKATEMPRFPVLRNSGLPLSSMKGHPFEAGGVDAAAAHIRGVL